MNKYIFFTFSFLLFLSGIKYIINPVFKFMPYNIIIDFGDFKWLVGICLILLGIYGMTNIQKKKK
ncbi:hypothetical protein Arnit_2454 [Arcobacter nitrofigilis DSM 7299]|uniref:Uncharacterized protein n=1 Tax=Arcobacter nitrofigilis (strain ATCC 33309 / DSM 7299 / CCUG 15893 / LMG 7604 / NCTC 12251 / CI) TaxID=572480 RepID=D5UZ52_ARCNC|nr:hypothetical protein Arnit_2454 [Arcobacter nitrofigilis DSM 7299]